MFIIFVMVEMSLDGFLNWLMDKVINKVIVWFLCCDYWYFIFFDDNKYVGFLLLWCLGKVKFDFVIS